MRTIFLLAILAVLISSTTDTPVFNFDGFVQRIKQSVNTNTQLAAISDAEKPNPFKNTPLEKTAEPATDEVTPSPLKKTAKAVTKDVPLNPWASATPTSVDKGEPLATPFRQDGPPVRAAPVKKVATATLDQKTPPTSREPAQTAPHDRPSGTMVPSQQAQLVDPSRSAAAMYRQARQILQEIK